MLQVVFNRTHVHRQRRIYFINTGKVVYADEHLQAGAGLTPDILPVIQALAFLTYNVYFIAKLKF